MVTVSQILIENVNMISIEILFLEEQDLSIFLVRHQKISYVMSMRRCKTQRTMPLSSTWELMVFKTIREKNETVDVRLEKDKRKMQIASRKTCFCFRLIVYLKNKKKSAV